MSFPDFSGFKSFDTSNVIDINCLFSECYALSLINLTNVNFSNTTTYFGMFDNISETGNIIYNNNSIRQEIKDLIPEKWNQTVIT